MKNYSKQREAIIEVLKNSKEHPTASQVYSEVRKTLPNISLGTVYRNLKALSSKGDALGLSVGDGFEHFDGDTAPHIHLFCRCCGTIFDLPIKDDMASNLARNHGFSPEGSIYIVNGVCETCSGNND